MCPAPWNDDPLPEEYWEREEGRRPSIKRERSYVILPARDEAVSHPASSAPLCPECTALELAFYNPNCESCIMELREPNTRISDVFAILRQWVPQVQQNIDFLVSEVFRMGAHPDDRDHLTDMSLLMYVCKAGATGVGDENVAAKVASDLVDRNAKLSLRCRWTHMTAIHYATYFDSAKVLQVLLSKSQGCDVDSRCQEFDNGSALHIAAANLSLSAAKYLLKFGADPELLDDLARLPLECIPEPEAYQEIPESEDLIQELTDILTPARLGGSSTIFSVSGPATYSPAVSISGKIALQALGLKVGDRVSLKGDEGKFGSLEYCGLTSFAPGVWAGVRLDEPEGRNDGSVQGVVYFKCPPCHGIFVAPSKVIKMGRSKGSQKGANGSSSASSKATRLKSSSSINRGRVDVSRIGSKLSNAIDEIAVRNEVKIGDSVSVSSVDGTRRGSSIRGVVRFIGTVDFVDDNNRWYGVELLEPLGKHDGSVRGVKYFSSKPDHGVFVTESNLSKCSTENNAGISASSQHLKEQPRSLSSYCDRSKEAQSGGGVATRSSSIRRSTSVQARRRVPQRSLSLRQTSESNSPRVVPNRTPIRKESNMAAASASPMNRSQSMRRNTPPSGASEWSSVGATAYNKFKKSDNRQKYLEVGTTAICVHNKEMGTIRFIGRVHFASGIWVGLELRSPNGKHDGVVEGRRYFSTKTNHGLMLKPKRLSVHGINAEKLLRPESEYPF